MIEIRFHGRGGQGAVIAAELLAQAANLDGKTPQSFAFYGAERRGAPVVSYARIDDRPILLRTAITAPDIVVVLDPGLVEVAPVMDGLKPGGTLLVNSPLPPERFPTPKPAFVATLDATQIALSHGIGSRTMPIVNTTMLGALSRVSSVVSLSAVQHAIDEHVPARPAENGLAAIEGFHTVRVAELPGLPGGKAPAGPVAPALSSEVPEAPIASMASDVLHTSSWRTLQPVITREKCTRCNFCWKFCPDNAIDLDAEGFPVVRNEHCKGCGLCAVECPPVAIEMVVEGGA